MLKRKRQRKYLIKRWLALRCQLYAFADSGSQEALHKFRVELKKIKAFIKLEKLYKGGKKVAIGLKPVREVFHRAGTIRDANINLQMIKQFHINDPALSAESSQVLEQEAGKFRSHTANYHKYIRNTVGTLLKSLRSVRNSDIKHWFSRQLKKIAIVVTASSTDQLHEARKRIKNLVYIHGIFDKRLTAALTLNITYLDQLQDAIGKWHDTALALELLTSHKLGTKAKINRLQKEEDKTKAAVHTIGDDFMNKVHEGQ